MSGPRADRDATPGKSHLAKLAISVALQAGAPIVTVATCNGHAIGRRLWQQLEGQR